MPTKACNLQKAIEKRTTPRLVAIVLSKSPQPHAVLIACLYSKASQRPCFFAAAPAPIPCKIPCLCWLWQNLY